MEPNFMGIAGASASYEQYNKAIQILSQAVELNELSGKTILIVGYSGLIGNALIEIINNANATGLLRAPIELIGAATRLDSKARLAASGVTLVQGSVADPDLYKRLPECDYIIYVAGTTSDYLAKPRQTVETQTYGLQLCLERFKICAGFLFISSTRVYGRITSGEPLTEETQAIVTPMQLDNVYDSAKRLGESLCLRASVFNNTRALVVRLSNIYGLKERSNSHTIITTLIRQSLMHRHMELTGPPISLRNYCSAIDAAQGILKTLMKGAPGQAYNIGSAEHLLTKEVAEIIAARMPFEVTISNRSSSDPPSIQRVSIEKAKSQLKYIPLLTLEELVPAMVVEMVSSKLTGQ